MRAAIVLSRPHAVHTGTASLHIAAYEVDDAGRKDTFAILASVALVLSQDHQSTALTIRRTTMSASPDFLGAMAPVNITDGCTGGDNPISLARRRHDGVVVGVEASCSGPTMLASTPTITTWVRLTDEGLLLLLFSHNTHALDAWVCQRPIRASSRSEGTDAYVLKRHRDGSERGSAFSRLIEKVDVAQKQKLKRADSRRGEAPER